MYNFQKGKTYKFGLLTPDGEQRANDPFPLFRSRPSPVSVAGDILINLGIKNFNDYLTRNIHEFPFRNVVHCYVLDDTTGTYNKCVEGNPIPKEKNPVYQQKMQQQQGQEMNGVPNQNGLSDNPYRLQSFGQPYDSNNGRQQQREPERNNVDISQIENMFKSRLEALESAIREKDTKINALIDKSITKDEQIGEMKAVIRGLEIENEKMLGSLNSYIDRYGGKGIGLSDGGSKLLDIIAPILQNEQVGSAIGAFLNKVTGGNKAAEQQQPQQQSIPEQRNYIPDSYPGREQLQKTEVGFDDGFVQ